MARSGDVRDREILMGSGYIFLKDIISGGSCYIPVLVLYGLTVTCIDTGPVPV